MRVKEEVIKSLETRLIQNVIPNRDSPCYLYGDAIKAPTLHPKQSNTIKVRLLHDPETKRAGLFANTRDPIEYRFEMQSVLTDLYKHLQSFFDLFKVDNLKVNRNYTFPTNLDAATTVTA